MDGLDLNKIDLENIDEIRFPAEPDHREEHVTIEHKGVKISGVLSVCQSTVESLPGCRVVVLAHGLGNTKDSAYHKALAARLTRKERIMTFRFDFRCGGESSGELGPEGKQTVEQYVQDLDIVINQYLIGERRFSLFGIVGHSLGLGMSIEWASRQTYKIPTIVNCSSPFFQPGGLTKWILAQQPDAEKEGYFINASGDKVPFNVLTAMDKVDSSKVTDLNTHFMSIYGLDDEKDSLAFGEMFNEAVKGHSLRVIKGADHDLKVKEGDYSKAVDIIGHWFSAKAERDRFMASHRYVGLVERWKRAEGVSNLRDCGGYTTSRGDCVRPGILYRGANPATATNDGLQELEKKLGIKTIVDLRSQPELDKAPTSDFNAIKTLHCPVFGKAAWTKETMSTQREAMSDPVRGYMVMYENILRTAGDAYATIVREIIVAPNSPLIFHCSAGKDRTGMFVMLVLLLLDVDHDTICHEYELTTEGLVAELPKLIKLAGKDLANRPEQEIRAMLAMSLSRYESCMNVIEYLKDTYGTARDWFRTMANLSEAEVDQFIKIMTVSDKSDGWVIKSK